MARLVALLRGINVGRANRIAMADLKELLASLDYSDVVTVLNSGNVVFSASGGTPAEHARRIEAAVAKEIGVKTATVVLSAANFSAAANEDPFRSLATDASRFLLAFTQDTSALQTLAELQTGDGSPDSLAIGKQAAYLWCSAGILKSKLVQAVNRKLGDRVTMRNGATVQKINLLLSSEA